MARPHVLRGAWRPGIGRRFRLLLLGCLLVVTGCDRGDLWRGGWVEDSRSRPGEPSGPEEGCLPPDPTELAVRINEVQLRNETGVTDDTGEHAPWVELYNPTAEDVDLGAVALSDDLLDAEKWTFPCDHPDCVIPAGGFLVVWLDGRAEELGGLHAGFTIDPEAGDITLILNVGSDIVDVDTLEAGVDESDGRFPDGSSSGRLVLLSVPTPGATNEPAVVPTEAEFIRGDANEDNRVNVSDLTLLLAVLFQEEPAPSCEDRLDVNDDGVIDNQDSTYLSRSLYGTGEPPPAPFPGAGFDPTADDLSCPAEGS